MADMAHTVELYIRLRDEIEKRDKAHKESLKPLKDKLEQLGSALLGELDKSGGDNFSAKGIGTVYKRRVVSATMEDWQKYLPWVVEGERWEFLNAACNKTAVEEYQAANGGALPPGVKYSASFDIGVRRATGT